MYKKGWKFLLIFLLPAFFFSCATKPKKEIYYKALPPKVKIKKNGKYEEVIIIKKSDDLISLDEEDVSYINRESKKLGIRVYRDRDIRRFIYFYAIKNKKYSQRVLERASLYLPMIKAVFKRYGLPEDLSYLPFIESGFNPFATSSSGAAGLWQFLAGTGRRFGLKINRYVDERRDPYKSTIAAAKYLKYLYNIFGRWDLAISAYNCGEGCILSRLKYSKKNFWDIKYQLPKQTQEYLPRFLSVLLIVKNPHKYGLRIKKHHFYLKKKVARRNISLKKVSYIYDIDYDFLKMFNAHFKKDIAIKGYNVYLPVTKVKPKIRKVSYKRVYIKHVVKKGETLYRISKKYNVSIEEIKKVNNIVGNSIRVGQVLRIPKREYAYRYDGK